MKEGIVQGIVLGLLGIAGPLGCSSGRPPNLSIVARGAQSRPFHRKMPRFTSLVSLPPEDNLLASVVVKNATDRNVQDFDITWIIFRPANCAISGSSPRIQQASGEGHQIYAENPSPPLPRGQSWGDRVFKPHEQIEVKSLLLTRTSLLETAKKYHAKKLHVQVGIGYVTFTDDKFTPRSGLPDWRFQTEVGASVLDAEDAARQACSINFYELRGRMGGRASSRTAQIGTNPSARRVETSFST